MSKRQSRSNGNTFLETTIDNIPRFRSAPWCLNGHFHTIGRSLFSKTAKPPCHRVEIPTADRDFLELDLCKARNGLPRPVVALFHGLEGSTDRYYITELMRALWNRNCTVVAVNFRSCGSRMNRQRRFYHSGETGDYATVFDWIGQQFPGSRTAAVGFSLGGNALLKSLGEERTDHPLDAAVAVSVPYDLSLGSKNLASGFNRVYEYRFLRTLRQKLETKRVSYPDLPRFRGSTLYEFDDQVTAKIHGFRNAEDYYESCSARHFIDDIRRPTLLIHSREDPICPVEAMPLNRIRSNRLLDYIITDRGGHVGFWSRSGKWLNEIILNFFEEKIDI